MPIEIHDISSAQSLLQKARHIIITNHINPDADAMGSALAMQILLRQMGKQVQVVVPNRPASSLNFLPLSEEVIIFDEKPNAAEVLQQADLIVQLDYNALNRSGPMEEALRAYTGAKLLIDHHREPEAGPTWIYSDTSMSSTCEMVYHFALAAGLERYLNRDIATCLYSGIMTDTGNFRFSATTPTTHRTVAHLLELGAVPHEIASALYDDNSPGRLKLLSCTLDNMEVYPEAGLVLLSLNAEQMQRYNYQKGDTEGFVNYGLSIRGISMSVFCTEKEDGVKISFRSKGNVDVNAFARQHFNGGGHLNAAGGISHDSLENTLKRLREILNVKADQA